METEQQQAQLERLYENESLTDNLTDADAKALLKWAEEKIRADTDGDIVMAAVGAANASGEEGVQTLLSQANAFVAQQSSAAEKIFARAESDASDTMSNTMPSPNQNAAPKLSADASVGTAPTLTATADASSGTPAAPSTTADAAPAPTQKTRAKKSRKKNKSK